jgi:NitT/TauT family transport system ATP-binding protein
MNKEGIVARNVNIHFGSNGKTTWAVKDFSLTAEKGEFVCIIGPTGCGKTTFLNAIAGFIKPAAGELLLDGVRINGPHPDRGVVFQEYALFPWKTVHENVGFGLKLKGMDAPKRNRKVNEIIEKVGLSGFEKHYPSQLSGGMKQRVSIARVLINDPVVLLMDEPFGALDAQTRMLMQELLLEIWSSDKKTVIFVTHDLDEAVFLADRIYVMSARPGTLKKIIDVDIPRPRNLDITTSREFSAIKNELLHLIRKELVNVE